MAGNSSVAAAVVVVVALQAWTHQKNIKDAIFEEKKAPAGLDSEIPGSKKKDAICEEKKSPCGRALGDTWLKIKKIIPLDPIDIILLNLRIRAPSRPI